MIKIRHNITFSHPSSCANHSMLYIWSGVRGLNFNVSSQNSLLLWTLILQGEDMCASLFHCSIKLYVYLCHTDISFVQTPQPWCICSAMLCTGSLRPTANSVLRGQTTQGKYLFLIILIASQLHAYRLIDIPDLMSKAGKAQIVCSLEWEQSGISII